jgi:hypothetical protein
MTKQHFLNHFAELVRNSLQSRRWDRISSMQMAIPLIAVTSWMAFAALPVEPGGPYFENDQVKVFRALEKAHVKSKFHEHKVNRVMVYLQSGRQSFEYQDGRKPQVFDWKAGQVVWSPADGMHSPEVLSDLSFNIVEVELKNAGSSKPITSRLDPVKIDPKHYKVEFENNQVRVTRVRVGAHESIPMNEQPLNRVTVFLTDQVDRITDSNGKIDTVRHKAGEVTWGTPTAHKEENLGDETFEVMLVEIKS